jgi:hypothetical protein
MNLRKRCDRRQFRTREFRESLEKRVREIRVYNRRAEQRHGVSKPICTGVA